MKRLCMAGLLMLGVFMRCDGVSANEIDISNCLVTTEFYDLWIDSFRGSYSREVATWVAYQGKDDIQFVRWSITPEQKQTTWNGPKPLNAFAIAHTHPTKMDPKPSRLDRKLAMERKLSVYTISMEGIWMVDPAGVVTKMAGRSWYYNVSSCNKQTTAIASNK